MELEEYLGIWQLQKNGDSIPLSYRMLCNEIECLDSENCGHKIIQQLECENYICTLPNGKRVLTELGLKKRIPLPARPNVENMDLEKPWEQFRALCGYYADCITQSEKKQEYLFEDELNNKFILPVLDPDWITSQEPFSLKSNSKLCRPVFNRLKARQDDDEDVYIGYPQSVFKCTNGKMAYSPILLFPVDVKFDMNDFILTIRQNEVDINRTWLEYNVPHHEQKDVQCGICFSEGDKIGLIDVASAVQYIANRFKVDLNPDYLDYSVYSRSAGIANVATLFIGKSLKYSKTLKKELFTIAKEPASMLDKTALAYIFRNPPLVNEYQQWQPFLLLDFLKEPSNFEQQKALDQALNQPVSKITGPPGTGKSQVAVNLIANQVFYGKSVLFTSKNHKAIHAIDSRCTDVLNVPEVNTKLSLIQFCSTPDGEAGTSWQKIKIDDMVLLIDSLKTELKFTDNDKNVCNFFDTLDNYRDWYDTISSTNNTRQRLQAVNARLDMIIDQLSIPIQNLSREYLENLRNLAQKIGLSSIPRKWWQRIFDCILRRKQVSFNAESELRLLVPYISATAKTPERLRERIERLCNGISDYLDNKDEETEILKLDLEMNLDSLVQLSNEMLFRKNNLKRTFLFNLIKDIPPEEKLDNIKTSLKHIKQSAPLPFLMQIRNEETPEKTISDQKTFQSFLKCFPAWAATLLSLSKASPCIAGVFDKVIIDEASQCEIPPIIPALYRAKSVTVIGDSKQFPPIITLREARHTYLRYVKHKLSDLSYDKFEFINNSIFDIIPSKPLMLKEHFRCHEDIIAFCNEEYYGNKLRVRTNTKNLKFPQNMGFNRAIEWRNVTNSIDNEINSVKDLFENLRKNGYDGTIGVVSPLRSVVEKLKQVLYPFQTDCFSIEKDVHTANGFQGSERDLVVFVLGYTEGLTKGENWYITAPENDYIYNVAASRARACLIIVGDRIRASQSHLSALRRLAEFSIMRPAKQLSQSPGEERLYQALKKTGLNPVRQYPLAGRYLDMALLDAKMDIEVDGEGYHLNKYGERKMDDIYRDLQIMSNGWIVIRFWYREVRDNLDDCVKRVLEKIGN